MFVIIIFIFISIIFLIMICHICRKLCRDEPLHPPPYMDPQSPAPPQLGPMPALPSLPGGGIPMGLEPPPYSEVTAKPFLYPLPQGPCPECGHNPEAQRAPPTQTNFWGGGTPPAPPRRPEAPGTAWGHPLGPAAALDAEGLPAPLIGGHPDACVCGPPPAATLPKAVLLVHSGGALYLLFEKNPKLSLFCCFGGGSGEGALGWAVLKPP
nr:basic salivary proline-rich protein 1-like [Anas platyrhynchos]XP_038024532.1 basic salivary proline-rich protein 1-like [Anas platyrhynchos]